MITGASDGIGGAAARRLARAGARVVVVGRSPEKTAAVAAEVGGEGLTADFARLDDVRRLAAELVKRCPRIDVLVNNAGASFGRRELTVDGYERTIQVDQLAPYLLTRLLEPQLRAGGARVVTTASFMHRLGWYRRGHLAAAVTSRRYLANRAYGIAKLTNVLFTAELARRWAPDISATCYDPGGVATSFGAKSRGLTGLAFRTPLIAFLATPEQGADTLVWLATARPGEWVNGGYHVARGPSRALRAARDPARARELWEYSAAAVGLRA